MHRDLETINCFLDNYVDREVSEDRGNEKLMLVPLGYRKHPPRYFLGEYERESALSLSHVIQRGLDYPRRSFSIYLKSKQTGIYLAILNFTVDDQLVIGFSIEDTADEERVELLVNNLVNEYKCHLGMGAVEEPPPISERAFRDARNQPTTRYFCEANKY